MLAQGLVGVVPAVVDAVADGGGQGAVLILALELAFPADSLWTSGRLIIAILAIFLTVTP